MNKVLVLPIIAALVCVLPFSIQDAHATSFTAVANGNWNSPATWGGSVPTTNPGDTILIPAGITVTITSFVNNQGDITVDGTLKVSGAIFTNDGTVTIDAGGVLENLGTGTITTTSIISNNGVINNHGLLEVDPGSILNTSTINNFNTLYVNGPIDNTAGTINAECKSTINIGTNGEIAGNAPHSVGCPSIPEFPFSFSLVVMFVAVAAVYMGIRQKMSLNFKKF